MVVTAPAFAVTKIVTGGSTGLQVLGSALAAQYGKDSGGKFRVTVSGGGSGAGQTGAANGTFQIGNSSSDKSSSTPAGTTFTPITGVPVTVHDTHETVPAPVNAVAVVMRVLPMSCSVEPLRMLVGCCCVTVQYDG